MLGIKQGMQRLPASDFEFGGLKFDEHESVFEMEHGKSPVMI